MQMSIHNPKPPTLCRLLVHHYKVRLHLPFSAAFSDHADFNPEKDKYNRSFYQDKCGTKFQKENQAWRCQVNAAKYRSPKSLHRGQKEFRTHDK